MRESHLCFTRSMEKAASQVYSCCHGDATSGSFPLGADARGLLGSLLQELQLSRDVYSRYFSVGNIVSQLSVGFDTREFSSRVEGLEALAKGSGCGFGIVGLFEKPEATVCLGKPRASISFWWDTSGLKLFPAGGMQSALWGFGIF